jgi:hypothetical protein
VYSDSSDSENRPGHSVLAGYPPARAVSDSAGPGDARRRSLSRSGHGDRYCAGDSGGSAGPGPGPWQPRSTIGHC